jgi:hypothetical protein
VGGDTSAAAALLSSLRAKDLGASRAGVLLGSDTSLWATDGLKKDGVLESDYGVRIVATRAASMKTDVDEWLGSRIEYAASTPPAGSRMIATAAQYVVPPGAALFPGGLMQFGSKRVPAQIGVATYSLDDETAQLVMVPLRKNEKYVLVFALPKDGKTAADVLARFEAKWSELLAGAEKGPVEVTAPVFVQTVDRDVSEWLGLKEPGAPAVRERLSVSIGVEPPVRKRTTLTATGGVRDRGFNLPIWHYVPPPQMGIGSFGGKTTQAKAPPKLLLDRPFIYALTDTVSGQVVFAGICANS